MPNVTTTDFSVKRWSPQSSRSMLDEGALLVAAYTDGPGFKANYLEGAISRSEFEKRLPALTRERTIIFY